jgi:predicted ThiF/HesA family dinucleotide-utilizing enzyme
MSAWTKSRAQLAAMSRHRQPGDPVLEAQRQRTRGDYVFERVERLIEDWPPLTNEQLDKIAGLLLSARTRDDGAS